MRLNLELITAYLQKQPTVSADYLFGSHAKGTARADSDVDIAVLFTTGLSFKERFDLKLSLAGDLEELLTKQVDVVDLEEASYLLRHQVFLHGILLFEKNPRERVEFVVKSRREYFDFRKFIEQRNNALLNEIEVKKW